MKFFCRDVVHVGRPLQCLSVTMAGLGFQSHPAKLPHQHTNLPHVYPQQLRGSLEVRDLRKLLEAKDGSQTGDCI